MKTLFIESRYKEKFILPDDIVKKLPKQLTLATTIQFLDSIEGVKKQLEENNIKVKLVKGRHSKYRGQILGCDIIKSETGNYLYIGDGLFHPKALLLKGAKKVLIYNPFSKKLSEITEKDIEKIKNKLGGMILKFKISKNIGVIITRKPGQNRLKDALKFKHNWEKKGKSVYLFLTDTLDFNELENFPFIECWVNTACPRIGYDDVLRTEKSIINIDDV